MHFGRVVTEARAKIGFQFLYHFISIRNCFSFRREKKQNGCFEEERVSGNLMDIAVKKRSVGGRGKMLKLVYAFLFQYSQQKPTISRKMKLFNPNHHRKAEGIEKVIQLLLQLP